MLNHHRIDHLLVSQSFLLYSVLLHHIIQILLYYRYSLKYILFSLCSSLLYFITKTTNNFTLHPNYLPLETFFSLLYGKSFFTISSNVSLCTTSCAIPFSTKTTAGFVNRL